MEKKIVRKSNIYLVCPAKMGAQTGRVLVFLGKNMAKFIRDFNEKTKDRNGEYVKVKIKVFQNGDYEFKVENIPLIYKLRNRLSNYEQLSKVERKEAREKERKEISQVEFQELAQQMLPFLNTTDLVKAQKMVASTAKSAGVKIREQN